MRASTFLLLSCVPCAPAQLYQSDQACQSRTHSSVAVTYRHPLTDLSRTVQVVVEEPLGVDAPLPAVIWMHGGAGGGTPNNLAEWRGVSAGACYLSVTIGHPWPDPDQARALCTWMGRTFPDDCGRASPGQVKLLNVGRPFDLRAVLDHLLSEWRGRVDPDRIAVGGHSAGAGAALMAAGAARRYEERVERLADPRPRAFLAFSPQAPGSDGFFDESWDEIRRPTLIGTGAGDSTGGETAEDRLKVFEHLPKTDKYLLYLDDPSPHGRFGLGRVRCGAETDRACDAAIQRLSSAAVAFLDAYLRDRQEAAQWLSSNAIESATSGAANVTSK